MAEQPNVFGYMRISTQEERQKQHYNRQENALNKYAQAHDFEYVFTSSGSRSTALPRRRSYIVSAWPIS